MKTKVIFFFVGVIFTIAGLIVFSQIMKRSVSSREVSDKNLKNLILNETYLKNLDKIDSLALSNFNTKETLKLDVTNKEALIVSQFATWCMPCLREMKSFVGLKRNMPDLKLYFISKEKTDVLEKLLKKYPDFREYVFVDYKGALDYSSLPSSYLYLDGEFKYFHAKASNWNNRSNIMFLNRESE